MGSQMKIVCFMKYPREGMVKTRLAETVGDSTALCLYKKMLDCVMSCLSSLSNSFSVELCYTAASSAEMQEAFPDWELSAQASGDLGERLKARMHDHFQASSEAMCFIGSDCIDLDEDLFERVAAVLDLGKDLVLGPSDDGGYYLIALREQQDFIFENIDWSTEKVFAQTLERAQSSYLDVFVLEEKTDLDTFAALPQKWKDKCKDIFR